MKYILILMLLRIVSSFRLSLIRHANTFNNNNNIFCVSRIQDMIEYHRSILYLCINSKKQKKTKKTKNTQPKTNGIGPAAKKRKTKN